MLRDILEKIGTEYSSARGQRYTDHPLATFVRHEAPAELRKLITGVVGHFSCKGSVGAGNFAVIPWLATFDDLGSGPIKYLAIGAIG